jgi:hypothetical protein
MENICAKCQEPADLPLCRKCRDELSDFVKLANYLNSFKGSKQDLYYIISSEIANRESSIMSSVRVVPDYVNGTINLIAIEPSESTIKKKPWLWDRYLHTKQTINEIEKLRRAWNIIKEHHGAT